MTDDELRASLNDRQILALTLYGEGRGEPIDGRIAIGCVIRTRLREHFRGAATYGDVCLARLQFSCWNADDPNRPLLERLAAQLLTPPAPLDPILRECLFLAEGIVGEQLLESVRGANHYLTRSLYQNKPPVWARTMPVVATVGHHVFLRAGRPA